MQTIGDGTDERLMGDIPKRGRDAQDRPLIDTALGRVGSGLEPFQIEPPLPHEGLRPVAFTDGLDELTEAAMRANGGRVHTTHGVGQSKALEAAARRASGLGLTR